MDIFLRQKILSKYLHSQFNPKVNHYGAPNKQIDNYSLVVTLKERRDEERDERESERRFVCDVMQREAMVNYTSLDS